MFGQITGQDTREKYTGSEKKDLNHKHSALHEASENEEFGIDATCSPRSAGGDKPSTESLERGIKTSDRHAAALRRSQIILKAMYIIVNFLYIDFAFSFKNTFA